MSNIDDATNLFLEKWLNMNSIWLLMDEDKMILKFCQIESFCLACIATKVKSWYFWRLGFMQLDKVPFDAWGCVNGVQGPINIVTTDMSLISGARKKKIKKKVWDEIEFYDSITILTSLCCELFEVEMNIGWSTGLFIILL